MSNTRIISGVIQNFWQDVTFTEKEDGIQRWRLAYVFNKTNEIIFSPHVYFAPGDAFVQCEWTRKGPNVVCELLTNDETRPSDEEVGPADDVPTPFTGTTEDYWTTRTVGEDIPPNAFYGLWFQKTIPTESQSVDIRGYNIIIASPEGVSVT